MGKPQLNKLPISRNRQVSCLFHEMGKILAYFTKWAISWIGRNIYISSVEYFDHKKGSHDTENHCDYSISLVSTETPSVKMVGDKDLAEPRGSDVSQ